MKIATWNVNGVNGRLPVLLHWLEHTAPDIACLQEIKTADTGFPREAIECAGYGALWHGQKGYNGVAILARGEQPREAGRGLAGDESDVQSRYLEAEVLGVRIACIYLPNGNPQPGPKFDYKLAWCERLAARARELVQRREPVMLAGDFNIVPTDGVMDIYDPKSWRNDALLQPESRAAWQRLLEQGWTDALATLHPGKPMYTYWDYFRQRWQRNAGLRIDHLLLNAAARTRLVEAGVDRAIRAMEKTSDHAPAWVALAPD